MSNDISDEQDSEVQCPIANRGAGRPRACDAEARMQDLMTTAAELFLEKGYAKVSLEMIARKARVAVRTIYVKFGGKSGLFREILRSGREVYFGTMEDLETNQRPLREVLIDFGTRVHELLSSSVVIKLHRMVIAEAHHDQELAEAFFDAGPQQTRVALCRYFSRPEVRAQLRDLPAEQLAVHFMNCLMGDHVKRYLFGPAPTGARDTELQVEQRVDLFLNGTRA
ncbi:TetR family transcriptional regulator [Pseudoduganella flava]|uniref:TetR family transcriptional regulator n=1 Tax=Pseudoduganella flava TaxID=871742 RepID=A0A562PSF0_9BURK|nr:TetR/AcrR family transcriptional regulator [Pseudoduganella flava]QGZ39378.1 TetR family transcriptional regulator [Pseudoduganella flava]TWI47308.1 TetR family transcriptional regulator [Pseudoduganella flava]